jgi:hypothetical protein
MSCFLGGFSVYSNGSRKGAITYDTGMILKAVFMPMLGGFFFQKGRVGWHSLGQG